MRAAPARRAIGLVCVVAAATWAQPAAGGSGSVITLPAGANRSANGLRLSVDCRWPQGYGYRPVHFDVSSAPPSARERRLTVELGVAAWNPDDEFVTVAAEIEIPAGRGRASRVIAVPWLAVAQFLSLRVWEDGVPIQELSLDYQPINTRNSFGAGLETPRILFVAPPGPIDVSEFSFLGAMTPFGQQQVIGQPADAATFDQRSRDTLVEGWINYSGLDLVFLSLDDARFLAADRPRVCRALAEWTRTGGTLCVFGVGKSWSGLAKLEELLGCPATKEEAAQPHRGWEAASAGIFHKVVAPAMATQGATTRRNAAQATSVLAPPAEPPFVIRPAGFGRAVAIAEPQPFPGEEATWRWILASIDPGRSSWTARHGTAREQHDANFNSFLIADVGLPPIRTYQVLISVFVVAIGPVNYWLLKRRGRLHLFLFTVPLAAVLTSAAMLGYALLADGFASRLRARSVTRLDQRAGQAVRLARLSYYTGMAPSGGLEFPADTMVAPLGLNAVQAPFLGRNRRLVWRDGQHLTRGWLSSRMPTQYVTARADQTGQQLAVMARGPAGVTVENRLGTRIAQLLWSDAGGDLHHGGQIAAGAQRELVALETEDEIKAALRTLSVELSAHDPALPPVIVGGGSQSSWLLPSRRRTIYQHYQNTGFVPVPSLLEQELASIRADVAARTLPPRSYVAIVDRPGEVAAGIDDPVESQSLHVIYGRW